MMQFMTIETDYHYEETLKKSRFISHLFPIKDESEAVMKLNLVRKQHYQATHNCWAYHLYGDPSPIIQYSDDGEPAKTAGYPISQVINGKGLYQVLLVVTRYFGGIKLGVGGLIKAYTSGAQCVVAHAHLMSRWKVIQLGLTYEHHQTGIVMHLIQEYHLRIVKHDYGQHVYCQVLCRADCLDNVIAAFLDQSSGALRPEIEDTLWI